MDEKNRITHAGPIEMLAEWEGPAIHEPGVLFEETHTADSAPDADAAALADWIAATALSGIGHPAHEAIKGRVRSVLAVCRQRHGQPKLDEVKQQLFQRLEPHRKNRKITDAELGERIELLFREL